MSTLKTQTLQLVLGYFLMLQGLKDDNHVYQEVLKEEGKKGNNGNGHLRFPHLLDTVKKMVGRFMDNLSESRAGFIHSSYWESEPFAIKNNPDISPDWQSQACRLLPYKWRLMSQSQWGSGHWRISTTVVSSHAFWIDSVKVFYFC